MSNIKMKFIKLDEPNVSIMKKLITFCFILSVFSVSSFSQSINLEFDIINAQEVHTGLNGFNTGPMFNHIFESSGSPMDITDHCDADETDYMTVSMTPNLDFVTKVAEIIPSTLRFPGGTISNYYHLYEYTNGVYDPNNPTYSTGFGIQDDETKFYGTGNVIRKQYCIWDNQVQLNDPNENPNFIEGFKNLVLEIQAANNKDIEVIYVANLVSHFESKSYNGLFPFGNWNIYKEDDLTPSDLNDVLNVADPNDKFELYFKENMDAIQFLLDNGINVVGVELGNELYFGEYGDNNVVAGHSNVTIQSFMELAEIYTARIKAQLPDMKISVPTIPDNNNWHSNLINYPNSFYDAISMHAYYKSTSCVQNNNAHCIPGCTSGNLITDWDCRFDCGKCALDDYVKMDLYEEMEATLEDLPSGKKIWFTEWNLINPPNIAANNLDYTNTFLHAAFVYEHYLKQLEFNAKHNNAIEYSFHHRLGYQLDWAIIQSKLGEGNTLKSSYYTFNLVKELSAHEKIYYLESISLIDTILENDANIHAFYVSALDETFGRVYLCFTNKTDTPISINEIDYIFYNEQDLAYNEIIDVDAHYLQGNDTDGLYSTFGKIKLKNNCNTNCNIIAEIDRTDNPSLTYSQYVDFNTNIDVIPPYSMGTIVFDLMNIIIEDANENIYSDNDLKIFPNPTNESLFITLENENNFSSINATIIDVKGSKIKQQIFNNYPNNISLDVSLLNAGIYFLEIQSDKGIYTSKIIIE